MDSDFMYSTFRQIYYSSLFFEVKNYKKSCLLFLLFYFKITVDFMNAT